jgi:hypothetical protein
VNFPEIFLGIFSFFPLFQALFEMWEFYEIFGKFRRNLRFWYKSRKISFFSIWACAHWTFSTWEIPFFFVCFHVIPLEIEIVLQWNVKPQLFSSFIIYFSDFSAISHDRHLQMILQKKKLFFSFLSVILANLQIFILWSNKTFI